MADWGRERPDLDPGAMAVVGRILHLGRRLEGRVVSALAPFDLDYSELDVLATLRRSGAPFRLAPSDLARSVLITSGAMTACLNRLEARELVTRERDTHDRRRLWVLLTETGRELVDRAIGERFLEAEEALSGMSVRDRNDLARLLAALMAGLPE